MYNHDLFAVIFACSATIVWYVSAEMLCEYLLAIMLSFPLQFSGFSFSQMDTMSNLIAYHDGVHLVSPSLVTCKLFFDAFKRKEREFKLYERKSNRRREIFSGD